VTLPSVEFYLDNDLAAGVALSLRTAGHVAISARDLRLRRATDDEQLLVAADAGRVFVTHNEDDFTLLHDAWRKWFSAKGVQAQHAGILVVPQGQR
jgi:predicted nuclease of predicted toxin-antitoxin system